VEVGESLVELAARPVRVGGAGHQGGVVGNVVEPGLASARMWRWRVGWTSRGCGS
jgi:hypothetical protein